MNGKEHNQDPISPEELELLRKLWGENPNLAVADEILGSLSSDVKGDVESALDKETVGGLPVPEKASDQQMYLNLLCEKFEAFIQSYDKNAEIKLIETINDAKFIKALGDKIRSVIHYIINTYKDILATEDEEKISDFRANVLGNVHMGLETARQMTRDKDITPLEIKTLETIFNALKIPDSNLDIIRLTKEGKQEQAYKFAFEHEREDLDAEAMREVMKTQALLRHCKEKAEDPDVDQEEIQERIQTAENDLIYWRNLAYGEPFPEQQEKKLDEYYRFKVQLMNFNKLAEGKMSYDEMLALYRKQKSKPKKNDNETNA